MTDKYESVVLDYEVEHKRFEKEMYGLVRAIAFRSYKRAGRPKVYWNSMAEDACIFAWRAWRSLRLRGLDPQDIGAFAIADRAVLSTLQNAVYRALSARGDRSWADSIHNKRNGLKVRSNREEWELTGRVEGEQEESDLLSDWTVWKESLGSDDRELVEALETGNVERLGEVKDIKRRKRALADRFKEFRRR